MPNRRVAVIGLLHESNTFSPSRTALEDFSIATGPDVVERYADTHTEIAGFLAGLRAAGIEAVPLVVGAATPGGRIEDRAYAALASKVINATRTAGSCDGVLVAAHGAAVAEGAPDMDGHWLTLLRSSVGEDVPLICTLDLHANLSPAMIEPCDATIVYRTNPHLDTFERGVEAAELMNRTLEGEVRLTQAAAFPPVAVNILSQDTRVAPCRSLYELSAELTRRNGVLSTSVCLGFPYADVAEMGTSFIAVTDGNMDLARRTSAELASYLIEHRHDFDPTLVGVEDAVERAARSAGPVCLLDTGDNVGGGSAGDGTVIADVVARRGGPATFVCLHDPESVRRAVEVGIGRRARLTLGGKADDLHGPPLTLEVTVRSRHDGAFTEPKVRHGGATRYDMGDTVIVESDRGLTIQLTSKRIVPFSLNQLLSCNVDPGAFQILVAKGVHAPATAYEPVCESLIRVTTPGSTTPELDRLSFEHRRRPLYPFEEPLE